MSQRGSPSKPGSRVASPAPQTRSRSGSTAAAGGKPPPAGQFGQPLGYDPGRDGPIRPAYQAVEHPADNKNLDLPPEAYLKNPLDIAFPKRPGFNTDSKPCPVEVNQFRVKGFKLATKIYQYDISIVPNPAKFDSMCKKLWASRTCTTKLKNETKVRWLYDGKKLAWGSVDVGTFRIAVDLDNDGVEEKDKKPPKIGKDGKPRNSVYELIMRKTTEIDVSVLPAYLNGQIGWCEKLLEAMNFLDHLIRQFPSENMTKIKRNFFDRGARRQDLDTFLEVYKGTYASIRMNDSIRRGGLGLGVNVDVANTAFWKELPLPELMCRMLAWVDRRKWGNLRPEGLADALRPVRTDKGDWGAPEALKHLRKLNKLRFTVRHRGTVDQDGDNKKAPKVYIISGFEFGQQYGSEGGNARAVKFDWNGKQTSVADYFRENYKQLLRLPGVPLVTTTRAGHFPVEVCNVCQLERYPYKLDGEQTSKMIRFAVTRPQQRKTDIAENQSKLQWAQDPYMKQFGLEMDSNMAKVEARLITNPEIIFGNAKHNPGVSGRWDLRGKKFLQPNSFPLKAWAFVSVERAVQGRTLQEFANTFKAVYMGHGGKIEDSPLVIDQNSQPNMALAVQAAYQQCVAKWGFCQFLFIVLRAQNTGAYDRIKKSADCRYGLLTQCVQSVHVEKNSQQYHSNVAMKVNAKLGGVTCKVPSPRGEKFSMFTVPTMMIGVDVSHAAPGSPVASMAAMTMSMDRDATRYAASCDTNGHRVEMIQPSNVTALLHELYGTWLANSNPPPAHIYYFRDGVAESQYIHVLKQEVHLIKEWFRGKCAVMPKFTVIVATKRHHIRFFPVRGDRNQNPLPGTLVETEVTHPFQWDFYLCSHVAIQGTARPVHYTVIHDEANCQPNQLQRMIYAQCYQYIRSTTPVSLHPAVYYAHLASNRARFHEDIGTVEGGYRSGGKGTETQHEALAKGVTSLSAVKMEALEIKDKALKKLGGSADADPRNTAFIKKTMWYI